MLRECKVCNGTDDALLKGGSENERTFLLSRWFHCVKLPVDVMEEDHPYHNLFTEEPTEHLFVAAVDGSGHEALQSETSRVDLWDSMKRRIAEDYRKKPDQALKTATALLDKFDVVDTRLAELQSRRDEILEEDGPKSRKLPKLERSIRKEFQNLTDLKEDMAKASELVLLKRKLAERSE